MRIAIVAHNLRVAGGLSVGRNVIASCARVAPHHDYMLVLPAGVSYESVEVPPHRTMHWMRRRGGAIGHLWFDRFTLPSLTRNFRPDVVWCLGNYGLSAPPCRQAILFHQPYLIYDAADQKRPVWRLSAALRHVRSRIRACLPRTDVVFCQTQTAAQRFRRFFPQVRRVEIMPNAFSKFSASQDREPPLPEPLKALVGRCVLFCLTRYYPHKNLESLVDAIAARPQELGDVSVLLTIRREDHPGAARLLDRIEREGLSRRIVNVGPLPQEQLGGYFRHVDAMILPTVLESFSGSYLEAMAFDCPILTSRMDFAEEICGEAAVYFDPWEPRSIADAIIEFRRGGASLRASLVDAGRKRLPAVTRSWDEIVAESLHTLESLVPAGPLSQPTTASTCPGR